MDDLVLMTTACWVALSSIVHGETIDRAPFPFDLSAASALRQVIREP
jgi:hypothetical protein